MLPVEGAALFGGTDLCRGLQLDVAGRRSRSVGIFIPAVHLTREQKFVICQPSLHHGAEGLISVNHSARVRQTLDVIYGDGQSLSNIRLSHCVLCFIWVCVSNVITGQTDMVCMEVK